MCLLIMWSSRTLVEALVALEELISPSTLYNVLCFRVTYESHLEQ